jgi:exodeoxyribonuclease V alpha subunit
LFDPENSLAYFHGMPILITSNDYARELYNGDVGIVLRGAGGEYRGVFQRGEGVVSYFLDFLPSWEPAFAVTVHKSQGSEYEKVLLVLPEDPENRLLTKEMIYTGLTRARSLAVIYGKRAVLEQAVSRRTVRESGIRAWTDA